MTRHYGECPQCGQFLEYDPALAEQVECPKCHTTLAVPREPETPEAPAPPAEAAQLSPAIPDIAPPSEQVAAMPDIVAPAEPAGAGIAPHAGTRPARAPGRAAHGPAGAHHGSHTHRSREELLAAHKREAHHIVLYTIIGGLLGIGLIVGIVAVSAGMFSRRQRTKPVPKVDPTTAIAPEAPIDPLEVWARQLFSDAQRTASDRVWLTAESHLNRLRRECAKTRFYAENEAAIEALWAQVRAALRSSAPPSP